MSRTSWRVWVCLGIWLGGLEFGAAAEDVRFNRDVRPILSQTCFQCHGPDEQHREAELRLDTEPGIRQAFQGGVANSTAWKRVSSRDADLQMPPPDSNLELTDDQRQLLRAWIEQGADWEGHWAFIRPVQPRVPETASADQVVNPIDAFLLERLQATGHGFSPGADRARLIRRVTLDLTGLPPTPADVQAFVEDDQPGAYERVVDRLLSSQHFGERMAVAWMDAARYGDSSVFHADGPRDMWAWRDWVIDSYNANKPFDIFTVEQLAGDLISDASTEQQIATGFLRNNATTDEGGAIAEEFRVEYAVDRVKTTSMIWLGLSLECAQCHNHKYDPISQREYYQFFAYFNQASDPGMQTRRGNQSPIVEVFSEQQRTRSNELKQLIQHLESQRTARREASRPEFEQWLESASVSQDAPPYPADPVLHFPLDREQLVSLGSQQVAGDSVTVRGQAAWGPGRFGGAFENSNKAHLALGNLADFERDQAFSYGAWIKPRGQASGAVLARMKNNQAFRGFDLLCSSGALEVHIVHRWPDNAIKVRTAQQLKPDQWQHVFVCYDGSSKASGIRIYVNGAEQKWSIEQDGLTESIRNDVPLYVGRRNPDSPFNGLIDEVRVYDRALTGAEVETLATRHPAEGLRDLPAEHRTEAQTAVLFDYFLETQDRQYGMLTRQLDKSQAELTKLAKPLTTVMVMQDVGSPRDTFILERGNYASPKKETPVAPGVPEILPPLAEDAPTNRLGLAQWLVRSDHPLTARVTVNRYWAMLFGQGLVRTIEDFGVQGEWPSHPGLLDWLAVDFVDHGWNIKRTLKQMVMSRAYRQSSRASAELLEFDPDNRLLARGPRFRLQAEFLRDQSLAVSGLLVPKIGGPSVKPYQPPGLWNEVSLSGNVRFQQDSGDALYRRSLYTYWKRSAPAPTMTIFDAPTREKCVMRRSRTNTPLQALALLNDPQFVEAARHLAQRGLQDGGATIEDRVRFVYRQSLGSQPSPRTLEVLVGMYREELDVFQANPERAAALLAVGDLPRDKSLDAAQHAALTIVTTTILNLDEFVTRG